MTTRQPLQALLPLPEVVQPAYLLSCYLHERGFYWGSRGMHLKINPQVREPLWWNAGGPVQILASIINEAQRG